MKSDDFAKREFLYITIASQAIRIKELREALKKISIKNSSIKKYATQVLEKDAKQ
jgi:hypothetical protein